MKFKEMSWEELKKDFENLLDNFTTQELIDSLKEYEITNENYTFTITTNNNVNEIYNLNEIDLELKNIKNEEYLKNRKCNLEIKNDEYKGMEVAA